MILPAEVDDALDALHTARTQLGYAVDALNALPAAVATLRTFTEAHDAVSWSVEHVTAAIVTGNREAREWLGMEAVEERHIECQTFPWVEDER